jgi:hypothetical protein
VNSYNSFVRQLSIYGFKRTTDRSCIVYYHPQFERGYESAAALISRTLKASPTKSKTAATTSSSNYRGLKRASVEDREGDGAELIASSSASKRRRSSASRGRPPSEATIAKRGRASKSTTSKATSRGQKRSSTYPKHALLADDIYISVNDDDEMDDEDENEDGSRNDELIGEDLDDATRRSSRKKTRTSVTSSPDRFHRPYRSKASDRAMKTARTPESYLTIHKDSKESSSSSPAADNPTAASRIGKRYQAAIPPYSPSILPDTSPANLAEISSNLLSSPSTMDSEPVDTEPYTALVPGALVMVRFPYRAKTSMSSPLGNLIQIQANERRTVIHRFCCIVSPDSSSSSSSSSSPSASDSEAEEVETDTMPAEAGDGLWVFDGVKVSDEITHGIFEQSPYE